ncbi:MAG: PAS domain-containing protein [Parvibaculum sp.]|uniref:PAS domain-containing protein n=1 Tax=Parvibaculum sp. TaxID=2024848 RepID=UPI0032EB1EFB
MIASTTFHARDCQRFFEYWKGLPKNGVAPDRSAFDPVAIRDLTPMMVMVEYQTLETAHFRYAGSKLTEILGFDPTRSRYLDLLEESAVGSFFNASLPMLHVPCGGRFNIKTQSATGYFMNCEAVDLPFVNSRDGTWIVMALIGILGITGMHDERSFRILEIENSEWIDIGAGLPGPETATKLAPLAAGER